jgi:hypothetical protein
MIYHAHKLCMYNLRMHEGDSVEGKCFQWNELNGKRIAINGVGTIQLQPPQT